MLPAVQRSPGTINYGRLPTEQINASTRQLDRLSTGRVLHRINKEDQSVAAAVRRQLPTIEKAVDLVVRSLLFGGRLIFLGAGTSGRLGVLEAAECPPTFNTPPSMVQAFMAGGKSSVFRSKEGAEDRGADAVRIVRRRVRSGDVVVGIAASGVTPFVAEGLREARRRNAKTILVTCHPGLASSPAHVTIAVKTGPEVITGSTRLKAGTATKLVLNSLTVASMVQLGKVYGNLMVDLQPRSRKLVERAIRLIAQVGGVTRPRAETLLKRAGGRAKTAIVMARLAVDRAEADRRLSDARGLLRAVIGAPSGK